MAFAHTEKTNVVITADNRTAKAFREVGSAVDRTRKQFAAFAKGMAVVATAGAAVAGGLLLLSKRAIESADAIGKTADKIGVGVEALQELRFAAEQTGVETRTLDLALQRFSRRVGEAAQGGGELRDTLEQYGIQLRDSEGRTRALGAVMADYAEAVKNAESEQEQLRLAFKAFDSEGAALVNLMRQGADGIEAFRAEARNLGIVLDEDLVRGAERANDAINRMRRIIGVSFQRVMLQLAPVIEQMGVAFANAAPKIAAWVDQVIRFFFGVESLSLSGLRRELEETQRKHGEYLASLKSVKDMSNEELAASRERLRGMVAEQEHLEQLIASREKELEQRKTLFESLRTGTGAGAPEDLPRPEESPEVLRQASTFGIIEELTRAHNEAVVAMNEQRRQAELQRERLAAQQKLTMQREGMLALHRLATLQASSSRRMFEVGKAAAIAETVISTYKAAQESYAALAGIPIIGPALGAAAAAAALASGFARVQAIKSQQFGGGGTVASGSGGASGGAPATPAPPPDVPQLAPPERETRPRVLNLHIEGDSETVSRTWIADKLAPAINEWLGDGGQLNISQA